MHHSYSWPTEAQKRRPRDTQGTAWWSTTQRCVYSVCARTTDRSVAADAAELTGAAVGAST